MKTMDKNGKDIEACTQLSYLGYTISLTTIKGCHEVGVITPTGRLLPRSYAPTAEGVAAAMAYIDGVA